MRISYNWLKDYVDVKLPAEKLAELLTMAGLAVEAVARIGGDYILEVEVTSNRPDCLSVIGIAREVAALTGKKLKIPSLTKSPVPRSPFPVPLSIKVEDKKLCPRYTARAIRNVKVAESPVWLKKRIETMGLRPVNNIVDITNFCLFETGEPMHAFDLDKIEGGEIMVRRARKGEKIKTIDGIERALDDSALVIADKTRPIAIAGVMGGLDTEVTGSTKDILLEAAYFDPISIRRISRKLGISTESSYRFERRVDIENISRSSERAGQLICQIAFGVETRLFDIGKKAEAKPPVDLRYSRLNKILGVEIKPAKVKSILSSLGLKVKSSAKDRLRLDAPGFRYDLRDEIDIIEEVSRVHGYDRIPDTIPAIVDQPVRVERNMMAENRIRQTLASLGCDEIITYSLLGKKMLRMASRSDKEAVEIKNPLTSEQEVMRSDLLAGMLNSILWNMNRKNNDLRLFEIGNVYLKGTAGLMETKKLSIAITGLAHLDWMGQERPSTFFDLKGTIEALFSELGIDGVSLKNANDERFSPSACAEILLKSGRIGVLGRVNPGVSADFDIKAEVYFAEIHIEPVIKHSILEKRFTELPRYPSIFRDISIVVGKEAANADMISLMRESAGPILKEACLIDRYTGKQIPDGKIGLTYRLEYKDSKRTLEEKDVSEVHSRILNRLEGKFNAALRG